MDESTSSASAGQVKPGSETTEYRQARQANTWGIVGLILGGIIAVGPGLVDKFWGANQNSVAYIAAGGALSVVSVIYKMLVDLGYIKSRTDVKVAQQLGSEQK
ncbi:hypothetical protein LLG95_05435 [bacterium]|nr:hypothetical protein [bacterium]